MAVFYLQEFVPRPIIKTVMCKSHHHANNVVIMIERILMKKDANKYYEELQFL